MRASTFPNWFVESLVLPADLTCRGHWLRAELWLGCRWNDGEPYGSADGEETVIVTFLRTVILMVLRAMLSRLARLRLGMHLNGYLPLGASG